ncbi:unnamed protein product [Cylicocyclus nassatus]|uniref:G-protein coupled receptors family 1 profile domain-containing protein n=1 Tax=Cylicocyclus nassatus TaxID=53992 RepID=A0AA36DMJ0_CYLNA|nr:unnamed protein product [Cylicocyclus nassatus]
MEVSETLFERLYLIYMPCCVLVGSTGNAMVWILIKSNRMLSRLPTNTYLLCLAAMSSLFLCTLFVFWLEEVSYIYLNDSLIGDEFRNISCKVNQFLAHVCDFSSVWLIVLLGCERLILLHRKTRSLTTEKACAQVVALIVIAMLFNSWILYVASIQEGICDIDPKFDRIYHIMTVLETIVCMVVPSIIIFTSNVLVICKLNAHIRKYPSSPAVSFNTPEAEAPLTSATSLQSQGVRSYTRVSLGRLSAHLPLDLDKPKKKSKKGLKYTDVQLTRSLMVVTWAFIILNMPNYIYRMATNILGIDAQSPIMQNFSLLAHFLLYTHHAVLFYLYIFYSPQMKRRLRPTAMKLLERIHRCDDIVNTLINHEKSRSYGSHHAML